MHMYNLLTFGVNQIHDGCHSLMSLSTLANRKKTIFLSVLQILSSGLMWWYVRVMYFAVDNMYSECELLWNYRMKSLTKIASTPMKLFCSIIIMISVKNAVIQSAVNVHFFKDCLELDNIKTL